MLIEISTLSYLLFKFSEYSDLLTRDDKTPLPLTATE